MAAKQIILKTENVKVLVKLLSRGLAYTDTYYRDSRKMCNLFDKVVSQLHRQGGHYRMNGEISFERKR